MMMMRMIMMMVTVVVIEKERDGEGGYLSVSCALHCPGQTELAYSPCVRPGWVR